MLRCTKEINISILLLLLQATVLIVECTTFKNVDFASGRKHSEPITYELSPATKPKELQDDVNESLDLSTDILAQGTPPASPQLQPQAAPHTSPQLKPQATPQASPQLQPIESPQASPKLQPKESPQASPQLKPIESPQASPKLQPQATPQASPQLQPIESPQVSPKLQPQVTPQASPQLLPKISPQASPPLLPTEWNNDVDELDLNEKPPKSTKTDSTLKKRSNSVQPSTDVFEGVVEAMSRSKYVEKPKSTPDVEATSSKLHAATEKENIHKSIDSPQDSPLILPTEWTKVVDDSLDLTKKSSKTDSTLKKKSSSVQPSNDVFEGVVDAMSRSKYVEKTKSTPVIEASAAAKKTQPVKRNVSSQPQTSQPTKEKAKSKAKDEGKVKSNTIVEATSSKQHSVTEEEEEVIPQTRVPESTERNVKSAEVNRSSRSRFDPLYELKIESNIPEIFSVNPKLYDCLTNEDKARVSLLEEKVRRQKFIGVDGQSESDRINLRLFDEYVEVARRRFEASKNPKNSEKWLLPKEFFGNPPLYDYLTEREKDEILRDEQQNLFGSSNRFHLSSDSSYTKTKRKQYINIARSRYEASKASKNEAQIVRNNDEYRSRQSHQAQNTNERKQQQSQTQQHESIEKNVKTNSNNEKKSQTPKFRTGFQMNTGLYIPPIFPSQELYDCLTNDEKIYVSSLERDLQSRPIDEADRRRHQRIEKRINEFFVLARRRLQLRSIPQKSMNDERKSHQTNQPQYTTPTNEKYSAPQRPIDDGRRPRQSQQPQSDNYLQRQTQIERERRPYQSNQSQRDTPPPIERERRQYPPNEAQYAPPSIERERRQYPPNQSQYNTPPMDNARGPYQSNRPSGWGSESNAGPSDQRSAPLPPPKKRNWEDDLAYGEIPLSEYDDSIKFDDVISSVYNSAKNLFGFGGSSQKPSPQNNNQRRPPPRY